MALIQALYGCRYRSPIRWFKVEEADLIGPNSILEAMKKVSLIRERSKTAQSHKKSYKNVRRRKLKFVVGD